MAPQTVGAVAPLPARTPTTSPPRCCRRRSSIRRPRTRPTTAPSARSSATRSVTSSTPWARTTTPMAASAAGGPTADLARYQAATAPLVRQFSAYRPFPGSRRRRQADPVGEPRRPGRSRRRLRRLPHARSATGPNDQAFVRQQDREFFIGFARSWRSKFRDGARCARRSPATTPTPRRPIASPPCATWTPGTQRSTSSPASASIWRPGQGCGFGELPHLCLGGLASMDSQVCPRLARKLTSRP